jgi:hypothetical protein
LSGVGRALTELDALSQLWSTSYGRALLVKSVVFLLVLTVAWANRSFLARGRTPVTRSVAAEVVAVTAIVVTLSVLTELRPARETRSPSAAPLPVVVGGGRVVAVALRFAPDRLEEARRVLERREP